MAKSYISIIILLICPFTISFEVIKALLSVLPSWIIYPERCNPGCIRIYQWSSGFAGLHIPKFTVQIVNEAWDVKGVYDVHIACPAFASTTLINPKIFRRIDFAVCLLYNGSIINPGQVFTFDYSNVLPYPLIVLNLKCV